MSEPLTDERLDILIVSLQEYKDAGVVDPWLLNTGEIVEPLDCLLELREHRRLSAETTRLYEAAIKRGWPKKGK